MFAYCVIIFTVKDDVVRIDKFSILISFFLLWNNNEIFSINFIIFMFLSFILFNRQA